MPGEFFTILFSKKILTNHFFVAFKCRKAKDGDDDVGGGERPVVVWDEGGSDEKAKEEVGADLFLYLFCW